MLSSAVIIDQLKMFGFQWSGNELQRMRVCEPKIYFFVKNAVAIWEIY